jgi:hypothetical protein
MPTVGYNLYNNISKGRVIPILGNTKQEPLQDKLLPVFVFLLPHSDWRL